MKVLILGIGNPVPTFILRRIKALDAHGLPLLVAGNASNKEKMGLKQGTYVVIPELNRKDIFIWTNLFFRAFVQPLRFVALWKCFKRLGMISGFYQALKHWSYVQYKEVDLVHLQWLSMGADYTWLRQFYKAPVIASARGSQVTVYPVTRAGYKDQIIKAIHAVDAIHCVSQSIQQRCIDLGAPAEKTFVNYNGIDTDLFQPGIKEWWQDRKDQTFRLITVGSLMWRKGIHYQLMLLKALLEQKQPVHLHIIGNGPDMEGLQYQALRLGVQEAITWEGRRTETEIVQLLQLADVYISTSAAEGLSNSVVEAAACGLPVLAFECEGMEEVLGHDGMIIPYGSINMMADTLIKLMQNQLLLKESSESLVHLIGNNFTEDNMVKECIMHYKRIGMMHKLN